MKITFLLLLSVLSCVGQPIMRNAITTNGVITSLSSYPDSITIAGDPTGSINGKYNFLSNAVAEIAGGTWPVYSLGTNVIAIGDVLPIREGHLEWMIYPYREKGYLDTASTMDGYFFNASGPDGQYVTRTNLVVTKTYTDNTAFFIYQVGDVRGGDPGGFWMQLPPAALDTSPFCFRHQGDADFTAGEAVITNGTSTVGLGPFTSSGGAYYNCTNWPYGNPLVFVAIDDGVATNFCRGYFTNNVSLSFTNANGTNIQVTGAATYGLKVNGSVKATQFLGDGSLLTGLPTTNNLASIQLLTTTSNQIVQLESNSIAAGTNAVKSYTDTKQAGSANLTNWSSIATNAISPSSLVSNGTYLSLGTLGPGAANSNDVMTFNGVNRVFTNSLTLSNLVVTQNGLTNLATGSNGNITFGFAALTNRGVSIISNTNQLDKTQLYIGHTNSTTLAVTPDTVFMNSRVIHYTTPALETASLGAELTDATGWTSTGWTGSYATGFTNTAANTNILSRAIAGAGNGIYYQIAFTISNRVNGSFTVSIGGSSGGTFSSNGPKTVGPKATGNGALIIIPTSDFDGTIAGISVKQISPYAAMMQWIDSALATSLELRLSPGGQNNIFIGIGAGQYNTTGSYNTANGLYALNANTTGSYNTANGFSALYYNTTGIYNTANGFSALYYNTTGSYNTANGLYALNANTTGNNNTANGYGTLFANTTGNNNTANGYRSMRYATNTTGVLALGWQAGTGITDNTSENSLIDTYCTFIGYQASRSSLVTNTTSMTKAIAIGYNAMVEQNNTCVIGGTNAADQVNLQVTSNLWVRGSGTFTNGIKIGAGSSTITNMASSIVPIGFPQLLTLQTGEWTVTNSLAKIGDKVLTIEDNNTPKFMIVQGKVYSNSFVTFEAMNPTASTIAAWSNSLFTSWLIQK